MRVVLDGRAILLGPSGVRRVVGQMLDHLPRLDPTRRYAIFSSWRFTSRTAEEIDSAPVVTATVPSRALLKLNERWGVAAPPWGLGGCDIFHTVSEFPIRFRGAVTISTFHDCFWKVHPDLISASRAEKLDRAMRHAIKWNDHIVTVSAHAKADLVASYPIDPDRITVVYSALDLRLLPGSTTELPQMTEQHSARPYILYVGAIEPRKNLLRLVRGFAQIHRAVPHVLVLAVSTGTDSDYHRAVERECQALGVGDRVAFVRFVTDSTLRSLYRDCSAFAFPSLYEGFGFPPLEAMAWGKPVLVSNAASLPEVVGDAALIVDPLAEDQIAEGLLALLKDDTMRASLARRAIDRAAFFTARRMVSGYQALYDRIA